MIEGTKVDKTQELLDLFEPNEGSVNMYYGRIGNGKTYSATADVLDLLSKGRVVYVNWKINYEGYDQRKKKSWVLMNLLFFRKRFFHFPKENLKFFEPDDVSIEFLSSLTDCDVFIDEGQWIFDSYEGTRFSKEKRRLILHTRHVNRSLNIISQRTQAIQVSARGQVNRFYKCEKKMQFPFLIFKRTEYQDMSGDDVDENAEPISVKTYFARRKVMEAYDSKYLRAGIPKSQELYVEAFDFSFKERWNLFIHTFRLARLRQSRILKVDFKRPEWVFKIKKQSLGVKLEVATINSGERLNTVSTGTTQRLQQLISFKRSIAQSKRVS